MANLFTDQTPAVANASDGAPGITTATTVRFAQAGTVAGIRFYATTTVSGAYTGLFYQVDAADDVSPAGTLLASKTLGSAPTGGAWNTATFDTPVSVETGVLYRACLFSGAGRYVATTAFFVSDVVNGDITADANGDDPVLLGSLRQGTFAINAAATYPSSAGNGTCYFVDVEFTPAGAGVSGSGDLALPALTTVGAGTASAAGAATLVLPAIAASGAGSSSSAGSAELTLPAIRATGAGGPPADEVSAPGPVIRTSARDRTLRTSTRGG